MITYQTAVQLLAGDDTNVIKKLDGVLGLGLRPATAAGPQAASAYFDAKNEFVGQLTGLLNGLKGQLRGSTRFEYEQTITAAHAVIVMASFSAELRERLLRIDEDREWLKALKARREARGAEDLTQPVAHLVTWASRIAVKPPGPARASDAVVADLQRTYRAMTRQALDYLRSLSRWEELEEVQQWSIESALRSQGLVDRAIQRYQENYVQLGAEVPEFLVWILINESIPSYRFTTGNLRRIGAGDENLELLADQVASSARALEDILRANTAALGDLPAMISSLISRASTTQQDLGENIAECNKAHQLVLDKPLLTPRLNVELEKLQFPANRVGYINPDFRLYETKRSDEGIQLAQEAWWEEQTVRRGLGGHLAAYLRTSEATRRPLLVLGDPGSGKSLLSKVLAANLPTNEFAVARVELRHVRSSQEVSDQIDLELQRQTNKRLKLSDLTDPSGRIVRVVIMDGLDELLQLSSHEGLGRYLEKLTEFQEIEATYNHPVIAIATARTIVMDRVFVPTGTTVMKLEGFTRGQISSWIQVWNARNDEYFSDRELEPLSSEILDAHYELARQPLLLALLALYDAEENALRNAGELSQAQLYERLFKRYLEREIEKDDWPARRDRQSQLIEQRFRELSTIAIGMLNRGRRFITRQELEADYNAVALSRESRPGVDAAVSTDDAVGQFFFLYRATAQHRGSTFNEGYEFIHATFEEFLSARMIAHQLARAATITQRTPVWDRPEAERHARSLLSPYLTARPLAGEEQVLTFLSNIMGGLVNSRRNASLAIAGLVPSVLRFGAEEAIVASAGSRVRFERLATLSINLVLASLYTANDAVPLGSYCLPDQRADIEWRRLTVLWKTYLAVEDWDRVLNSIHLSGSPEVFVVRLGAPHATEHAMINSSMTPDMKRTILEARLVGDKELAAAILVWSEVRTELQPFESPEGDSVPGWDNYDADWRLAAAAIRVGPAGSQGNSGEGALQAISSDPTRRARILDIIEGGIGIWTDSFLSTVARLVADLPELNVSASSLLRLAREADHRGRVADARRLLLRLPDTNSTELSQADTALIIILSRRHQLRDLVGHCVNASQIDLGVLERLGIDDVVWLIDASGIPGEQLAAIRRDLLCNAQYIRMTHAASILSSWIDNGLD